MAVAIHSKMFFCRATTSLAELPGTHAQTTADVVSMRALLQQQNKALQEAQQLCESSCQRAEMQKLALGSLEINVGPGTNFWCIALDCDMHRGRADTVQLATIHTLVYVYIHDAVHNMLRIWGSMITCSTWLPCDHHHLKGVECNLISILRPTDTAANRHCR